MSRVNVEFTAIADAEGRFARLANLLGLADADHARGKMEHLWMACTERGSTELPQWRVEQVFGPHGPGALVESELARWGRGRGDSNTRLMVIAGAHERCLWKARLNEQSRNGGKTRARNASRVAGKFTSQEAGDTTSAPTPSPIREEYMSEVPETPDPDPLADIKAKVAKAIPREAYEAADLLRERLLIAQPNNAIRRRQWDPDSGARRDWANDFRLLAERDKRTWPEILATIRWLFAQTGEYQFVCHSPDAIRAKWDRIQAQRNRGKPPVTRPRPNVSTEPPPTRILDDVEKESA